MIVSGFFSDQPAYRCCCSYHEKGMEYWPGNSHILLALSSEHLNNQNMPEGTLPYDESLLNSVVSFVPLVNALKKNISEGSPGMKKLYGHVLREFESHRELMHPIPNLDILFPHSDLIEELLAAVFPPTTANHMYGVSIPFKYL